MVIKVKAKGEGKTNDLIITSSYTRLTIVCFNKREAERVFNLALRMGYDIPEPITFGEFMSHVNIGKGYLIDNIDECLSLIARKKIYCLTATSEEK